MTGTYAEYVGAAWSYVEAIRHLYSRFARRRPVMLLELPRGRIYAYPYGDFKADLSPRSQRLLEEQYAEAIQTEEMVVFVRDEQRRKLVSFNLPVDKPRPNRGAARDRGQRGVRTKGAASGRGRGG